MSLNLHIKLKHGKEKLHKCSLCDYSTRFTVSLKKHVLEVHEKKKPYKCSICNYCADISSRLKKHVIAVMKIIRFRKQIQFQIRSTKTH
jgi:KRAB domain-containing zinc finger protein